MMIAVGDARVQNRLRAPDAIDGRNAMSSGGASSLDRLSGAMSHEQDLIRDAQNELWLVQETGSILVETAKNELVKFLHKGGSVNAVVSAPTTAVARLMAFRNANLKYEAILQRARMTNAHLADLQEQSGADAERLSVRYVPYPMAFTLAVADPEHPEQDRRRCFARYAGFKTPFALKLGMSLNGRDSPAPLDNFLAEAKSMYSHASKLVLVTGPPRSGKTTLLTKLVEGFPSGDWLFSLLSPELPDGNGGRLGFAYRTSDGGSPVRFADRRPDGTYALIADALNAAIVAVGEARDRGRIVVLDEIGPLQLAAPGFLEQMNALIADPRVTLIASLADPTPGNPAIARIVEGLIRHPRASVLRLQRGRNFDQLLDTLSQELRASAVLHGQMPRAAWGE